MESLNSPMVALLLAFLLGSIPFSWVLVWLLKGVDLRTVGSGNPGATNAFRVVGPRWGTFALLLDIGKGLAAATLAPRLAPEIGWLAAGCGLAAILGNVYCPFLKFRGGKAVATAAGVFLGLAPYSFAIAAAAFAAVFWRTRQVSLGSILAAFVLPTVLTVAYLFGILDHPHGSTVLLVWIAALLVIARHRSNIQRILKGEELGFKERKGA